MRVLVVEDERRLAQNVANGLRECAGYAVDVALERFAIIFFTV
jgi:DNA-binding response OmpR family regulator